MEGPWDDRDDQRHRWSFPRPSGGRSSAGPADPKSAQALALRCRIVLGAAEGECNHEIAQRLGCHPVTVGKWRRRFAEERLDGLCDEPRPGRPRTVTDAQVERVIIKTPEEAPKDATPCSTRSMAQAVGLSQTAVSRIWRAFGPGTASHRELQSLGRPRSSSTKSGTSWAST